MKARTYCLLPFLLLLGAGSERIAVPGPLPACRRGEFLSVRDGVLYCRDLVRSLLVGAPDCTGQLAAPGASVIVPWRCAPIGHVDATAAAELPGEQTRAAAVEQKVQQFAASGPGPFVGTTTRTSSGFISRAGVEPGLLSANALCADEFPGTHLCSGYQMSAALASGKITQQTKLPRAWVFHPAWKAPLPGAQNAAEGLADNCASYTYGQDDRGWSGTAVDFAATAYPARGKTIKFLGGPAAPCSTVLPLACCK